VPELDHRGAQAKARTLRKKAKARPGQQTTHRQHHWFTKTLDLANPVHVGTLQALNYAQMRMLCPHSSAVFDAAQIQANQHSWFKLKS
jgi:hypothetical protein